MKIRKFYIPLILMLFLSCQSLYSQQSIDKKIFNGLNSYYNFNWRKAEYIFQDIIQKYPDDPRGYHYESSIYFWYYFSNKDKEDLEKFIDYSDKSIEKALAKVDSITEDPNLLYILGANYIYRAIAFTKEGKFLDAVWATKKSESFLKKVIEINPKYYDAYFGLGLYNFALGQIPKSFQWTLSLAGMKGDKEKGIEYIKNAVNKGKFTKIEAKFYYAQILSDFFADYSSASKIMLELVNKFPNNLLFNYSLSAILIKERELNKAQKILKRMIGHKNPKFKQLFAYTDFLLGDVFFKKNEFDSATVYFNKFIISTLSNDYTGITNYWLAICYEAKRETTISKTYFQLSDRGNLDLDDDIYAKRRGKRFSEYPFGKDQLDLIKFSHYIDMRKYKTGIDSLISLTQSTQSIDVKAEAYLNISDALYSIGKYRNSIDTAMAIVKLEINDEKWVLPFAFYYAARAEQKLGNMEFSAYYIKKADSYKDFDYQNKLKNLIFAIKSKEKY